MEIKNKKEKMNHLLMIVMAFTKAPKKYKKTQIWAREKIKEKIKDSETMMKMFEQDCANANSRKALSQSKTEAYYNYIFGGAA